MYNQQQNYYNNYYYYYTNQGRINTINPGIYMQTHNIMNRGYNISPSMNVVRSNNSNYINTNNNNNYNGNRNNKDNSLLIDFNEFCLDYSGHNRYNDDSIVPYPHYSVLNHVPLPTDFDDYGKPLLGFSCFNCGEKHNIKQCRYSKNNNCIKFNRLLTESVRKKKKIDTLSIQKHNSYTKKRYFAAKKKHKHSQDNKQRSDKKDKPGIYTYYNITYIYIGVRIYIIIEIINM